MKLIVGDELGLLKCVDANKKILESKYGEIKKNNGVIGIDNLFENSKNLLSVTHQENFYILDWKDKSIKYTQNINEKYTSQVVKKSYESSTVFLSSENNTIDLFQFDTNLEISNYLKFDTGVKNLFALKNSSVSNEIFCLSKKSTLQVYNSEENKITWKSKNVPNDELDLMVPIWDTDLAQNKSNPNHFYTSTAFGNIRCYDRKVKPRPAHDVNILKNRINKVVETYCENYLIVGDTIGHMYMLDKRKNFQKVKRFYGQTGSIRDIVKYQNTPYVFACGLDRFLRIYDYKKNIEMPHIYLKNKLQCIFPYQIDFEEEKEELEYWESDEKSDDEMNELSDDSAFEKEVEDKTEKINKEGKKMDQTKKKKQQLYKNTERSDDENSFDQESNSLDNNENYDEEDDEKEEGEEEEEEEDEISDSFVKNKNSQYKFLNKKPEKPLEFKKENKNTINRKKK